MNVRENRATAELAAGDAHHAAGELDDAAAAYRRALALDDRLAEAWWGLGCIELAREAYAASAPCFASAAALCPDWAEARHNLGKSLFEIGEIEAALAAFLDAARGAESAVCEAALAAIATIIPGCSAADNAAVLHARQARAALRSPAERSPRPTPGARTPADRLRIGYVSSFFDRRNWMKPVIGVLNHHDRVRFELHLFCDGPSPGADTGFQPHDQDHIHDVRGAPNDGLATYIRRAGIDILVDLNGYSAEPRLGLYAHRPAPFVLGWFGLYATSGMAEFDFIIGDSMVVRDAEEPFYSERVLRVPGSYLAFSVNYPTPELVPPPCRANGWLTFGCLASQHKITRELIATWCEILRRAPSARLLIKNATLADASTQAALRARFVEREIAGDRIDLDGADEHFDFLAAYGRIDIALDTFPYNGATTTMEALWQGVPVLAFEGDRWASRVSCSLLRAAGLDAWCVADPAAYVERAVALTASATSLGELTELRAAMRERLAASRVCDSAGLCRSLERFYRRIAGVTGRRAQSPRNPPL